MSVADGPVLAMSREEANSLLAKSTDQAHEGRVYDYYLGGSSNYAVDRLFARKQIERVPDLPWAARQNRKFLTRVVQHMIDLGIRQFVDMGSGLPTEGNVHEIAEEHAPGECRVVYVDHDAVGLNPDLGNLVRLHRPMPHPDDMYEKVLPRSNFWHIKNYSRDFDPRTGAYTSAPMPLKYGYINYRRIIRRAIESGYT